MKNANDILKVPIIAIAEGEELGIVEDLIIDSEKGKVEYLIVNDIEWYLGAKLIAFENIKGIGVDVITTDKKSNLKQFSEYENAIDFAKKGIKIIGTKIYTETGVVVGEIDEIIIDENDGFIYGCEMLREKDGKKEKVIIPSSSVVTYGKHVSIVIDDVEQTFENDINASNLTKKKNKNRLKGITEGTKEKKKMVIEEEIREVINKKKEFEEIFDDIENEIFEENNETSKTSESEEILEKESNDMQLEKESNDMQLEKESNDMQLENEIEHNIAAEENQNNYDSVDGDLISFKFDDEEDDEFVEAVYADEEVLDETTDNSNDNEEDIELITKDDEGSKKDEEIMEDLEENHVDLDDSPSFRHDVNDKKIFDDNEQNHMQSKEKSIGDILQVDVKRKDKEELEKDLRKGLYEKKDEQSSGNILEDPDNNSKDSHDALAKGFEIKTDLKVEDLFRKKQREFLTGRVCTKNIENEVGEILIRKGEVIDEEVFDKVTTSEKLTELTMNSK